MCIRDRVFHPDASFPVSSRILRRHQNAHLRPYRAALLRQADPVRRFHFKVKGFREAEISRRAPGSVSDFQPFHAPAGKDESLPFIPEAQDHPSIHKALRLSGPFCRARSCSSGFSGCLSRSLFFSRPFLYAHLFGQQMCIRDRYTLIHTAVVFFAGTGSFLALNANASFAVDVVLMGLVATVIYGWLFQKTRHNVLYVLLIGTVLSSFFSSIQTTLTRIMAVSYTHLDVYKRQGIPGVRPLQAAG